MFGKYFADITREARKWIFLAVQGNFRKVSKRYFAVTEELSSEFLDSLQGLPTLKMFYRGKAQGEKIRVKSEKLRKETMGLLAVN